MGKLYLESGWLAMNKAGEQLCGDHVETVNLEDSFIMVLADGLGSGVKASILSTLTAKILSTMLAGEMTVEDCVETIALTLPVCKDRGIAYCTFTILQVQKYTGEVYLVQFDNPDLILLRKGKSLDYPRQRREIAGKAIYETRLQGQIGDLYIMMSDGAIHAGVGTVLNFGWQLPEIIDYAQRIYTPELSAKSMAAGGRHHNRRPAHPPAAAGEPDGRPAHGEGPGRGDLPGFLRPGREEDRLRRHHRHHGGAVPGPAGPHHPGLLR